jgi:hypothetical protein
MRPRLLQAAATLTLAACSQATAPSDAHSDDATYDIVGTVSTQQVPYYEGNIMRVTVTNLRLAPGSKTSEVNVTVDARASVRVAAHGCEIQPGSRSAILPGAQVSITIRSNPIQSAGSYQASEVVVAF